MAQVALISTTHDHMITLTSTLINIPFIVRVTFCTVELAFRITRIIKLNSLTFTCFVLFRKQISPPKLKFMFYLSRLIMNE